MPAQLLDLDHVSIRLLTRADGPQYTQLRLRSLKEDSDAFLSTFENESKFHEDVFANHLEYAYHPPHFGYFGLLNGEELIGYLQVSQTFLDKQVHIALINNLYIRPEFRGHGLSKKLFLYVFDLLSQSEHIERAFLTVAASNKKALHLYQELGFRRYAVKVKSIKWQGKYDDEIEMVKVWEK